MKKSIFQSDKGTPSMMRYLTFWAFWFGVCLVVVSMGMLIVAFFTNRVDWASHFMALAMAGTGEAGAAIAGKGLQKKYELGGINE